MSLHPQVNEWLEHPITKLMYKILNKAKNDYTDAVINSDGLYSEIGTKQVIKLIGQIQLIDQLIDVSELFPKEELDKLGEE